MRHACVGTQHVYKRNERVNPLRHRESAGRAGVAERGWGGVEGGLGGRDEDRGAMVAAREQEKERWWLDGRQMVGDRGEGE